LVTSQVVNLQKPEIYCCRNVFQNIEDFVANILSMRQVQGTSSILAYLPW